MPKHPKTNFVVSKKYLINNNFDFLNLHSLNLGYFHADKKY